MNKLQAGLGALLGASLVLTLSAQDGARARENPAVVVGSFDSRAVAVAYVRSDEFHEFMLETSRELERAREAGDSDTVARIEAGMPELQEKIHRQGFGAAPLDDILERIEDALPRIAQEAGVDVIVSKWVVAYRAPGTEFVDVTDLLAAEFDPDEETLKTIRELLATDPVPLDQLREDH